VDKPQPDASVSEFLAHFGVKGMKWGVRSSHTPSSPGSEDHMRVTSIKSKVKKDGGTKSLSNKELQDLINRINLERQFKTLHPSPQSKAVKFAADLLLGVGKQQITKLATDFATKAVAEALKK
jgi:hypothetical protein